MTLPLNRVRKLRPAACFLLAVTSLIAQPRASVELEDGWRTALAASGEVFSSGYVDPNFNDQGWEAIHVPHNWESYEGYRQLKHGNLHGTAWYRRELDPPELGPDQRAFLFFEGVGSYATIWLNGREVGRHAGGLTTFTLDITPFLIPDQPNQLTVRAEHPSGIRDLPWVCGGCELAYGFSEGTQPFGIFRPVQLVVTNSLRVTPFGVHVWNDEKISAGEARLNIIVELRNHGDRERRATLRTSLREACGDIVFENEMSVVLAAGQTAALKQLSPRIEHPRLWHPEDPYLYQVVTELIEDGEVIDTLDTPYGIRWVEWPDLDGETGKPLLINGEPFFVNGVADYEHLLGASHAFSEEQVRARVGQIQAAGYNTFRDAHHPHNLRFNEYWDSEGLLWWTQYGAHIWFDTEEFQANYKALLRDWIRERRNSPSLILYGLQNESKLPTDFARECADIIREMDPTASIQRLVTTCNGGTGTDWDVPQNWSGTYGGNLQAYDEELTEQRLVGEFGAWRSLEFHSEGGFVEDGPLTEDRMGGLMETKVRLAEKVRESVIGHFTWPFTTHQNPGRNVGSAGQQTLDGIREWDRIGPANNKGLLTTWGEPLDVFYMYRSNYADADLEPMVYIVSHTWPDRWVEPGLKEGIIVYSNAEEVELFNGYLGRSLGTRTRNGKGTHFLWNGVQIDNNVLYAKARSGGRVVATDLVVLHHLPEDPNLQAYDHKPLNVTVPETDWNYLYRVNCGGPEFTDINGSTWSADRYLREGDSWGSVSWAGQYENLHPFFGSKREIFDPVTGTGDDPLFQSFRYGREDLRYHFKVPDGQYRVELYFIEPWYGTGGGLDCTGWRLFDVALNGQTRIRDLDLWSEAGRASAVRKVLQAEAKDGLIEISFPRVMANQAVISAIAIASQEELPQPEKPAGLLELDKDEDRVRHRRFIDTGANRYSDSGDTISALSWELREADWLQTAASMASEKRAIVFTLNADADVFIIHDNRITNKPAWLKNWERTRYTFITAGSVSGSDDVLTHRFNAGDRVVLGPNGGQGYPGSGMYTVLVKERFPPAGASMIRNFTVRGSTAPEGWRALANFKAGQRLHSDGGSSLTRFSSRLSDADWIQTPLADAGNPDLEVSFQVVDHSEVFVALDPNLTVRPGWLENWLETDWYLSIDPEGRERRSFLKKRFAPGDTITLGPNGILPGGETADMYTAVLRTVRADQIYAVDTASRPDKETMDWTIEVGVGDRYGLNFRYRYSGKTTLTARFSIIAERDGKVVCEDEIQLAPTGGDWEWSRYRTCDDINAGIYFLRLENPALEEVEFEKLQVE